MLIGAAMHLTVPTVSECAMLLMGPALFSHQNLLIDAVKSTPYQDHIQLTLSAGACGSFDTSPIDFYGADSYSHLVEGEKIWFLAMPQSEVAFRSIFDNHPPMSAPMLTDEICSINNIIAIHQRAGDVVFIPGGWLSVAQHLTSTISFGMPFIRAWKLNLTVDYAENEGRIKSSELINIDGLFDRASIGDWGISAQSLAHEQQRWIQLKDSWNREQDQEGM